MAVIVACHLKLSGTKVMLMPNNYSYEIVYEDYLQNPGQAIAEAAILSNHMNWSNDIDEDVIYAQLASPEFRLYEDIVVS